MIKDIFKRGLAGVACGGIATFIALTIMKFAHIEASIAEVWNHMLASFGIGIYFGIASLIFENEHWSALKQVLIHYSLSIIVWLSIALPAGWVPAHLLSVIIGVLIFTVLYGIYWLGFFIYFKKIATSMNEELRKKHRESYD